MIQVPQGMQNAQPGFLARLFQALAPQGEQAYMQNRAQGGSAPGGIASGTAHGALGALQGQGILGRLLMNAAGGARRGAR